MRERLRQTSGPLTLLLALGVLGLSCGGSSALWWEKEPHAEPRAPVAATYRGGMLPAQETHAGLWREPGDAPGGWRYDLFTPPALVYTADNGWVLAPRRLATAQAGAHDGAAGHESKPELFRLQLAGYVGAPGGYRAVFVTPSGHDTWLAGAGHHFAELGLTVRRVEVLALTEAGGVAEVVARAVLWDERAATEVVVDNRAPRLAEPTVERSTAWTRQRAAASTPVADAR